jgi:hypothetical protein
VARIVDLRNELSGANERIIELEEEKAAAAEFRAIQPEALRLARACEDARLTLEALVAGALLTTTGELAREARKAQLHLATLQAQLLALLARSQTQEGAEPPARGGARVFAIREPAQEEERPGQVGGWLAEGDNARRRKRQRRGR